ncbi:MAG: phosphotransferase [Herpetosiphonaceae bacterium]|nr:MAG: phosphotransferase [Herpetosiphonaceae bacterium]
MFVDLHIHTIATPHHSFWEPEALARAAVERGLAVIAVTDHNTTAQVRAVQEAGARYDLRVISGVELDTAYNGKLWHTHLYGVDPDHPEVLGLCAAVVERNAADAQAMATAARERGWRLRWFATIEDRRPTVADFGHSLVKDGYVQPEPGVEDEAAGMAWVLRNMGELYHPVTVAEAAEVAHRAGGLAVLAHPGRSKSIYAIPATEEDIAALVAVGLDGLEALYTTHTPEQRAFYRQLAERYGLLISAGSDSHGPGDGLGAFPLSDCAAFLEALSVRC